MHKKRCSWCESSTLYKEYHDKEWGVPIYEDQQLFECLILETFQAGLSWITVLNKRENLRLAFDCFDYKKITKYNEDKLNELLQNSGIIRHKLKIRATVNNARAFISIQKEFGSFAKYIWQYTDGKPIINTFKNLNDIPPNTTLSDKIAKDLKKRGFKFVGSTVIYAYMQAIGMVNDHLVDCFRYKDLQKIKA